MQCRRCGSEQFEVIRVWRSQKWTDKGWVYSHDTDTRKTICKECSRVYLMETKATHEVVYREDRLKQETRRLDESGIGNTKNSQTGSPSQRRNLFD